MIISFTVNHHVTIMNDSSIFRLMSWLHKAKIEQSENISTPIYVECNKMYQSKVCSRILVFCIWPWYSTWTICKGQSCMHGLQVAKYSKSYTFFQTGFNFEHVVFSLGHLSTQRPKLSDQWLIERLSKAKGVLLWSAKTSCQFHWKFHFTWK